MKKNMNNGAVAPKADCKMGNRIITIEAEPQFANVVKGTILGSTI